MDVIITGATGFIGGAVVRQAMATDLVRQAFILTRGPLPDDISEHPKITVILHDDFLIYPPEVLRQLIGCEACIWCLGGNAGQFPDKATADRVSVQFPLAAATAFMMDLTPYLAYGERFRFVFLSEKSAEWDNNRTLFFRRDTRRMKGRAERSLFTLAAAGPTQLEVLVVRGAGIMAEGGGWLKSRLARLAGLMSVDDFAYELILISAASGGPPIIEMRDLLRIITVDIGNTDDWA